MTTAREEVMTQTIVGLDAQERIFAHWLEVDPPVLNGIGYREAMRHLAFRARGWRLVGPFFIEAIIQVLLEGITPNSEPYRTIFREVPHLPEHWGRVTTLIEWQDWTEAANELKHRVPARFSYCLPLIRCLRALLEARAQGITHLPRVSSNQEGRVS